jgi:hypothetical protein
MFTEAGQINGPGGVSHAGDGWVQQRYVDSVTCEDDRKRWHARLERSRREHWCDGLRRSNDGWCIKLGWQHQ